MALSWRTLSACVDIVPRHMLVTSSLPSATQKLPHTLARRARHACTQCGVSARASALVRRRLRRAGAKRGPHNLTLHVRERQGETRQGRHGLVRGRDGLPTYGVLGAGNGRVLGENGWQGHEVREVEDTLLVFDGHLQLQRRGSRRGRRNLVGVVNHHKACSGTSTWRWQT